MLWKLHWRQCDETVKEISDSQTSKRLSVTLELRLLITINAKNFLFPVHRKKTWELPIGLLFVLLICRFLASLSTMVKTWIQQMFTDHVGWTFNIFVKCGQQINSNYLCFSRPYSITYYTSKLTTLRHWFVSFNKYSLVTTL